MTAGTEAPSPPPSAAADAAQEIPRGARQMFGLKDVLTTVNVLSGVVAIWFCFHGKPLWASYSFLVGYAADAVDGTVARVMRAWNRFGAEYDAAADFVAQAVAPAFVLYTLYAQSGPKLGVSPWVAEAIGLVMAAVLVVVSSVRHARNAVRPVAVDFAWIGLPRNVASFLVLGFANSVVFSRLPGGLWLGLPLVAAVAWAELSTLPFMNHHGRKQFWWAKLLAAAFFTTTPLTVLVAPRYTWDVVLFWILGYSFLSWTAMTPDERRQVREAVAAANAKLVTEEIARYKQRGSAR